MIGAPVRISGYAAVFNVLSEDLGDFRERIAPGAFSRVLGNDVRALVNHDPNLVLGRTTAGTLRLHEDAHGLAFEVDAPMTTYAQDIVESLRRRDVSQMSFSFTVARDRWSIGTLTTRDLLQVAQLFDVSPVTFPAYAATSAAARGAVEVAGIQARNRSLDREHRRVALEALRAARCAVCGGQATSIDIEWRRRPPRGVGRCASHQQPTSLSGRSPARPAAGRRISPTPRLDAARKRLRELETNLTQPTPTWRRP